MAFCQVVPQGREWPEPWPQRLKIEQRLLALIELISLPRFSKIQNTKMSMKWDGIGSVRYRVLEVSRQPLFTNITVDIGRPMSWLNQG